MGCCNKRNYLIEKLNEMMKDFYYRLIRHDFVINKIQEFNKSIKNYHEFFVLTKLLGIHSDLPLQVHYWETAYVTHSETSIDGLLFIFLFLCQGEINNKLEFIKYYLSVNINLSNENDNNLIMNCSDFKKILFVYFSCLTTIPLNSYLDKKKGKYENITDENGRDKTSESLMQKHFDDEIIKSFTDYITKEYVKKNFYINAGKFLDANIGFLVNDNLIRKSIFNFNLRVNNKSKKEKTNEESSDRELLGDLTSENKPLKPKKELKRIFCCSQKKEVLRKRSLVNISKTQKTKKN